MLLTNPPGVEADEGRATGEAAGGNEEEGGTLPAKYGAFVFINSSCRGPFLPKYVSGFLHWATPFLSRLNQNVKLLLYDLHRMRKVDHTEV